jgi:hypothetical protein
VAARSVEDDPTVAQRDVGIVTDDEMVEQVDVEKTAGGERLGGQVQVVGRGRGVAGRMVVLKDHAGRVQPHRVAEQLADAHEGGADVALVGRRLPRDRTV